MEIIDRYVYAVVSQLPQKQRDDIEKEIRTLIDDMIESDSSNETELKKAEKVLLEIGDPNKLAQNYMDKPNYLIGPNHYRNYIYLLKIVLGAVFLGISIASVVDGVFSSHKAIGVIFYEYIPTLLSALGQAFIWVTLIFAIAEYNGSKIDIRRNKESEWNLNDLPLIPNKKVIISRTESILGIIFSIVFVFVLYFSPHIIGAYIPQQNGGIVSIPLFKTNVLQGYNLFVLGIFLTMLTKEVLKLIYGKWSIKLVILYSILSMMGLVLTVMMFSDLSIWNLNFIEEVMKQADINLQLAKDSKTLLNGFFVFIIAVNILDIGTVLYRGIKYGDRK